MNKYSQSVINNFTNEKNVAALFAALLRKYVAEYGPSDDIKCLLNSENNRSRMIRAYIDRVKNDLMYFGVTNPRVEDQVSYLNYEFTTEHLPLLYELSLKATNGWGGIAPMPSQKMNDEYSVSTRSMVSDAAREVVSDSNTHQSKYITNQTDNAPWKSPEQLVRESANKTLESWRYTSRPREMRDDRVGTLNLTPDTYAGALTTTDTNKRPNHNYDTFNNVGYSRKQPQGLDRGFAPNFPQCGRGVASAPLRKPNGQIEGFAGSKPVAAANLHPNSEPLSNGSFRFDTCSANPGEEYNKQFTDYIGPNVGTDNGLVVGNKWYFNKGSVGMNKNSVIGPTQNMNLTTGRNQTLGGGVRSTISCGIAGEYGGVNAQMNMNTPGRPYNATGNVDYGGETYDGVDDEPGTTYKKTDVPHLPSETQQHYRQLLDAPYMHLLNSGETPDLDPFVGNARLRSYNPNTATTSADNNYKINKNEYPLSQKYVPMKNSLYDDGASANIKSNKNNSNPKNANSKNTNSKNTNSKNTNSKNAKSVSITIGNSDKTINIGNTSDKSASMNKNSNNVSTKNAKNSTTKNTSTEHYYGQRPSSIIPNMKTCSAEDTPGAVFMGGALNGYKPPCFTFNVEASCPNKYTTEYSQFADMKSPLSAPNLRGPNDPLMATRNVEGQYMESNRPKTWTDGAGFVDQTDPKAMRRLLERRSFRTYGDVATGKYIEQTDPNISLDIFWSGQVYNNQTPFWERGLYQRRYDYDAEEAVGGFEMGNFQRGYDMSSLKSRVDNARKSYGKFDSYKVW